MTQQAPATIRRGLFDFARTPYRKFGRPVKTVAVGSLVPTMANTCVPICAPAGVVVIAVTNCARCRGTIVRTPVHTTIDASDAHRCQWTPNSGARSID
jgi:hypothetical protein